MLFISLLFAWFLFCFLRLTYEIIRLSRLDLKSEEFLIELESLVEQERKIKRRLRCLKEACQKV